MCSRFTWLALYFLLCARVTADNELDAIKRQLRRHTEETQQIRQHLSQLVQDFSTLVAYFETHMDRNCTACKSRPGLYPWASSVVKLLHNHFQQEWALTILIRFPVRVPMPRTLSSTHCAGLRGQSVWWPFEVATRGHNLLGRETGAKRLDHVLHRRKWPS